MDISLKLERTFMHFVKTGNGSPGYLVVLYEENRSLSTNAAVPPLGLLWVAHDLVRLGWLPTNIIIDM